MANTPMAITLANLTAVTMVPTDLAGGMTTVYEAAQDMSDLSAVRLTLAVTAQTLQHLGGSVLQVFLETSDGVSAWRRVLTWPDVTTTGSFRLHAPIDQWVRVGRKIVGPSAWTFSVIGRAT